MEQVRVSVCALDPITTAGVTQCLRAHTGLTVVPAAARADADVVVAALDRLSAVAFRLLRSFAAEADKPVVLLINEMRDSELPAAVECRVSIILPREAVTDERIADGVRTAAAGGASLPPDLLGSLVTQTERLHREVLEPSGLVASSLSAREVDVLRLMAEGHDTAEIARNLYYSERTVKSVIYKLMARQRLRNRAHAVAHALRAGAI